MGNQDAASNLIMDDELERMDAVREKVSKRRKRTSETYASIETRSVKEPIIYVDDSYAEEQIEQTQNEDPEMEPML